MKTIKFILYLMSWLIGILSCVIGIIGIIPHGLLTHSGKTMDNLFCSEQLTMSILVLATGMIVMTHVITLLIKLINEKNRKK